MMDKIKKIQLKDLLLKMSNDVEKRGIEKLDSLQVRDLISGFRDEIKENDDNYQKLLDAFSKYATFSQTHSQMLVSQFSGFIESFVKKLELLEGKIGDSNKAIGSSLSSSLAERLEKMTDKLTTSYEKNKPFNAAGVYKDMINQLSAVNESIKNKPVPVWSWPQYASVGVRDSSFKNIDPSQNDIAGTVGTGTTTVTSAGTPVQLPPNACYAVYIQAHESNAGAVAVGDSNVKAALSGRRGIILYDTNFQKFLVSNTNLLYVDAVNSSDKVHYYFEAR